MTESPSGQGAPEHDSEASLLTEPSATDAPPIPAAPSVPSVPGQLTRDDVEADETADTEAAVLTGTEDAARDPDAADETSSAEGSAEVPKNPLTRLTDRVLEELFNPRPGLLLSLVYIGAAMFITWKLLFHPKANVLAGNPYDQLYFEWQLTTVEHAILHLHSPLFTHAMNAPQGMNLIGNPQIIGPATVLTPVTALFGASVSFAFLTFFNLAAAAITWRWFLRRHVVRSHTAAFVGGLFLGFSPSMITHSMAHPNLSGQWLVPLILAGVLRLREQPQRFVRNGVILGVLLAAQVFVGEELLLLAAMGTALFGVAYVVLRPRQARDEALPFLRGTGVTLLTAGVLLAYPLTFQFFGPMSFKGIPFDISYFSADLKSYAVWPNLEIWADPTKVDPLAPGGTEQAALVGWVLLLVVALLAAWLVLRNAAARALVIAGLILTWLSLGPNPKFDGAPITWWPVGAPGLWTHLEHLPLFASSLPVRSALAVSWILGILLAMGVDEAMRHRWMVLRGVVLGGVVTALVPLTPRVFDTYPRPPIPSYFTSGAWKECVSPGHNTIVGVPLTEIGDRTNETWSTAADTAFDIPEGPVMGPTSPTDKQVQWSTPDDQMLWTAQWLKYIYTNGGGSTPQVTPLVKNTVRQNLAKWQANCVVMADGTQNLAAVKDFLDQAIAPGLLEGDVVVWREPTN